MGTNDTLLKVIADVLRPNVYSQRRSESICNMLWRPAGMDKMPLEDNSYDLLLLVDGNTSFQSEAVIFFEHSELFFECNQIEFDLADPAFMDELKEAREELEWWWINSDIDDTESDLTEARAGNKMLKVTYDNNFPGHLLAFGESKVSHRV